MWPFILSGRGQERLVLDDFLCLFFVEKSGTTASDPGVASVILHVTPSCEHTTIPVLE